MVTTPAGAIEDGELYSAKSANPIKEIWIIESQSRIQTRSDTFCLLNREALRQNM